jgi:1,4-dihydroxy-2-naphthoyl-CoA synthase
MQALALYYQSEESKEGAQAFREKRKANFRAKLA